MNKKQVLRASGAFLLVVAGAFAGRASSKKGAATALYYTKGVGSSCVAIESSIASSSFLTTVSLSGSQATLKTIGGVQSWKLYATSACTTHKVYFKG